MKNDEYWKDISEYGGDYQISNRGRVVSLKRGSKKFLKPSNTRGYLQVGLCYNGNVTKKSVHRLVAKAFIPNPENKPEVNHIDGNKKNNHVDNLEWCTRLENAHHACINGLFSTHSDRDYYSKENPKILKHFYIEEKQAEDLKILAGEINKAQAEIVREALDNHFKSKGGTL